MSFTYDFVDGLFAGRDWLELHQVVREGVARRAFGAATLNRFLANAVQDATVRHELREAIVSGRSWKRRVAEGSPLSSPEVERMTHVGEVVRLARRLYGGDERVAEQFLTMPNRRLGNRAPVLVAASHGGAAAVRELLARMEEGSPV